MLPALKVVVDPTAWLVAAAYAGLVAAPVIAAPAPDPFYDWTGIPLRVVMGGLLGSLIGQSFMPAATLARGVLAVAGGVGLAAVLEQIITAALSHYFVWWPRLPFATAALLGLAAPYAIPAVLNGIPALWTRVTGGGPPQ